jgi:nucleoid-associated protein YejK
MHMQEEVENRAVTLAISTTKLTARVLKSAISRYLSYRKEKNHEKSNTKPSGKQTLKQLVGQNQGVSNIEVTEKNIKGFDRVARKYGVDYAVKKDKTGEIPKYLVFFKARDADALTAAFSDYMGRREKAKERPSVITLLKNFRQLGLNRETVKIRHKEKGLEI